MKWASNVHPKKGALHGWHADESAHERHAALERSLKVDGYAETVRRLEFVANVNENASPETTKVARTDVKWLEREHQEKARE